MNNDLEMVIHCPVCGREAVVKLETDNSENVGFGRKKISGNGCYGWS